LDKKAVSGIMLTLLLTGILTLAFNIQLAEAQTRKVGVKVGDWAKYEVAYNYTTNDPTSPFYHPEFAYIEHFKTEVLSVSGTNITFRATTYFENGTEVSKVMWIDISINVIPIPSFFWGAILFTAANLTAGDTLTPNPSSDVVNATLMRTYAGAEREVNFVYRRRTSSIIRATPPKEQSVDDSTTYMFWDRATGVLVEANDTTIYYRIELDLNNRPLPGGYVYVTKIFIQMTMKETKASETSDSFIYIRADGSVDPPTAPILSVDNVTYTFTGNINTSIVVERDNIVVDGAGYTLRGTRSWDSKGIDLTGRSNVTIKNMKITESFFGIWLDMSSSNSISGNNITFNKVGIWLSDSSNNTVSGNNITANNDYGIVWYYGIYLGYSSNNSISRNYITNNGYGIRLFLSSNNNSISGNNITNNFYGILLWKSSNNAIYGNDMKNNDYGIVFTNSSNNIIYHNNFVDNTTQVDSYNSTNVWDDSAGKGNYWSDYEDRYPDAEEIDESTIWDTSYVIDENNQDNYPLMSPWGLDEVLEEEIPFWMQWWFWTIVAVVIVALAGTIYFSKKRKPPTPAAPTLPTEDPLQNTTQNTNPLNSYPSFL